MRREYFPMYRDKVLLIILKRTGHCVPLSSLLQLLLSLVLIPVPKKIMERGVGGGGLIHSMKLHSRAVGWSTSSSSALWTHATSHPFSGSLISLPGFPWMVEYMFHGYFSSEKWIQSGLDENFFSSLIIAIQFLKHTLTVYMHVLYVAMCARTHTHFLTLLHHDSTIHHNRV